MKSSRIKTVLTLAVLAMACFAMTTSAQAGPVGQLGILDEAWFTANTINPGTGAAWKAGDTYQLAFVTYTDTIASINPPVAPWDDIATFDAIAQADADDAGIGSSVGVTWNVIGSTATVDARDHAVVSGPVYTCSGIDLATGYTDMWDGSVANEITHIDGTSINESVSRWGLCWTGSYDDGTKTTNPLGDTDRFVSMGDPIANDGPVGSNWIDYGGNRNQDFSNTCCIYGLSEPLKVVFPEVDYIALKTHFGQTTSAGATDGDYDDDGDVDWDDLQILQDAFRELNDANANPIPEPASLLIMLGAGLPALLKRRRSRS